MISEKLHESLPQGQFNISGFSTTFKLDRNSSEGGITLFVREGIQAILIFSDFFSDIDFNCFFDCPTVNLGPFSMGQPP